MHIGWYLINVSSDYMGCLTLQLNTTMELDNTSFACWVDNISESEVLDELEMINYLVTGLLMNILATDPKSRTPCDSILPPVSAPDLAIINLLNRFELSSAHAMVCVVEFLLRDAIFASLHACFFDGVFFLESVRIHIVYIWTP
jgi:hypothetical protein